METRFLIAATAALALTSVQTAHSADPRQCADPRAYAIATYALDKNHGQIIGPPLSHDAEGCLGDKCFTVDEYEAVNEAIMKREVDDAVNGRCIQSGGGQYCALTCLQQAAYDHVMAGLPVRRGDFVVLHGMLLFGMRPETYVTAKKWQGYMKCVGESAKENPECVGY